MTQLWSHAMHLLGIALHLSESALSVCCLVCLHALSPWRCHEQVDVTAGLCFVPELSGAKQRNASSKPD